MRIIATWPDPRDGHIIDQSRDCGPGPFGDQDPFTVTAGQARGGADVSQSVAPNPYGGLTSVRNERNATAPSQSFFNGRRAK